MENFIDDYDMCAHNMTRIDLTLAFKFSLVNLTDFGRQKIERPVN